MENENLFELMTKIYGEMQGGFKEIRADIKDLKESQEELTIKVNGIESEVSEIKKTVLSIEDDHGKKIQALLDGYKKI